MLCYATCLFPASHSPSSSSFPSGVHVCRDPSMGRCGVLSVAFCSIWQHFEGLSEQSWGGRIISESLAFIYKSVCKGFHCPIIMVAS